MWSRRCDDLGQDLALHALGHRLANDLDRAAHSRQTIAELVNGIGHDEAPRFAVAIPDP